MGHYDCERCGCFRCECPPVLQKHPTGIPGFLTMVEAASYVENLRYDCLEEFLLELRRALQRRSDSDYKAGKHRLAAALGKAASGVGMGALHVGDAWRICEPHMEPDDEG